MQLLIEIPEYDPQHGFSYRWEKGFVIQTSVENGEIRLTANRAGLLSLVNHFLTLAQEGVAPGTHLHLDESNSLDAPSCALLIEKVI